MREKILVLDSNVLSEKFDKAISDCWRVVSGVDLFTILKYNLICYNKIFFCPNVDLETPFKSVKTSSKKISIKYGKNIMYRVNSIEILNTLKDKDIAIGSYIIFDGNNDVIDLMLKKSYIDIFNSQDLVKQLMQSAKFFVEVHDNEWQSMCFYQDKNKWYDFLSFLRNKTKVEMVDDWASLPK